MFDTLDIIISFIASIFILSLIGQSIQALIKKLLDPKTNQAVDGVLGLLGDALDETVVKNKEFKTAVDNIKKQTKVTSFTKDNIGQIANQIGKINLPEEKKRADINADMLLAKGDDVIASELQKLQDQYAYSMQKVSVLIAFVLAIALNADSFQLIEKIATDKTVRQAIIQSDFVKKQLDSKLASIEEGNSSAGDEKETAKEALGTITELASEYQGLNIGVKWSATVKDLSQIESPLKRAIFAFKKFIGIFITTGLVSMGAKFWYDSLDIMIGLKSRLRK